jgi:hypothetical protein
VTRFPALFTTGMHGTEHRKRKRRTPRLSAPRLPFSPATGSVLQDAPQTTSPARDRMLATAFRSPATAALFGAPISRSTFLACYFASCSLSPLPVRPFCSATPSRLAPAGAASMLLARCRLHNSHENRYSSLHSPLGLLPPAGSKRSTGFAIFGPPSQSARSPFAPHSRFLSLVSRLRITVPGPLRFRRLAVPQTSWNLSHYAPEAPGGQSFFVISMTISSVFISLVSRALQPRSSARLVDKSARGFPVSAILDAKCADS